MAYLYNLNDHLDLYEIGDLFLIGQDLSCDLKLSSEAVALRHARLEKKGETFLLRDLRSEFGTRVNEKWVQERILSEGDQVEIGSSIYIFSAHKPQAPGLGLKSKNLAWNHQLEMLSGVAITDHPVLILGPSGTGKEILSQSLHENSKRRDGPFLSVNCSALTETLIESELFGHVKGSFTGASSDRKGAFEAARGGTLFLDEIGDLPYGLQAKLLRALENNEIRPVGSDRTIKTNLRIIAATHQNLLEKIHLKEFRADLYFRLNVITVNTPALISRMEDFEDLLMQFGKMYRVRFSFSAISKLKLHIWPGNIRELKNTVARASAYFPRQAIEDKHVDLIVDRLTILPGFAASSAASPRSHFQSLPLIKEVEKQMIVKRLLANQGNQRRTAQDLGLPKSTLHDRLRTYQINPKEYSPRAIKSAKVLERLSL